MSMKYKSNDKQKEKSRFLLQNMYYPENFTGVNQTPYSYSKWEMITSFPHLELLVNNNVKQFVIV